MSQVCNTVEKPELSTLFGDEVESHIAQGSAFFCGATSEIFRFMAAGELNRTEVFAKHIDFAGAYLEASINQYDKAIRKAVHVDIAPDRADQIVKLDYARLYEQNIEHMNIPEMPQLWEGVSSAAKEGRPEKLLKMFRDELTTCLAQVNDLRQVLLTNPSPNITAVWKLGSSLTRALAVGQAVATIYQFSRTALP